jgi:hypothetical protein
MKEKFKQSGPDAIRYSNISPIAGIGNLLNSILRAEASYWRFEFSMLSDSINGFVGSDFFVFSVIEALACFFLGIYFFYVFPVGIGVPSHPLFFLKLIFNCKSKRKEE